MLARRIRAIIIFNKKDISNDISHSISSIRYTDNSRNAIDDLEIELENLDYRWLREWYPDEKAQLVVGLFQGDNESGEGISLGTFYIDEPTFNDNRLNLKCIALPLRSNIRDQKNTKAWEKITLEELISQIAAKHGMSILLHADNEFFERIDQSNETDLKFIDRICVEHGLSMKISDDKIIVFDEDNMLFNKAVVVFSIDDYRIRSFTLRKQNKEIYDKVEVSYYDPDKKKLIKEIITKKELEKRN
ncbi:MULTISPECIES: phage late control D family protein [Streptobacillus]|uniref:phage late control D family protein n=1 Tax=Streptobacillus TaxID=34104 RepID=UPI000ADC3877|nr:MULTISPECIES: contractile injection system protein, VgrG/Pvc8 family [Streptobacillus]